MDQQILQAVEIALSGSADPSLKQQAYNFIEQIKSTSEGYHSCLDILVKQGHDLNTQFKFFIFQVLDENICRLSAEELFQLSESLFKFLNEEIKHTFDSNNVNTDNSTTNNNNNNNNNNTDNSINKDNIISSTPSFLKNKIAGTFATLFCATYLEIRTNFLKELLAFNDISAAGSDYYIRIILAIHSEIGDKLISRSKEVQDRNVLIKDKIRSLDMEALIHSWKQILINGQHHSEIIVNTLRVIGSYVEWMEISYFIAPDFINAIFQYLQKQDQRSETCNTLVEIISKKMKPTNKLELLGLLNITSVLDSTTSSGDINDDVEWAENVAKLLNQVGLELQYVLQSEAKQSSDVAVSANSQTLALWPSILLFLAHEYDDVSHQVFPFISEYLATCKKYPGLVSVDLVSELLNKVIMKMKYGDDDEQFLDFRTQLAHYQEAIGQLVPDIYIERVPMVIDQSLFSGKTEDWETLELGLFELSNFGNSMKSKNNKATKAFPIFETFFVKLVNSDWILQVSHPLIQNAFFELIGNYFPLLKEIQDQLALRMMEIYTSPIGVFTQADHKYRVWYLFLKFVRITKLKLSTVVVQQTISKIQPLLEIKSIIPPKNDDGESTEFEFNGQMHLFEACGILISCMDVGVALELTDIVLNPIFADLEHCVSQGSDQILVQAKVHHDLVAIGTFISGFETTNASKYGELLIAKFNNIAQVVLITLETFCKSEKVRDASRSAFAHFIPILGAAITSHLSKLVSLTLGAPSLNYSELNDFLKLVGQIAHQYQKNDNMYQLLNGLVSPLVEKVFSMLTYRGENNDFDNMPDIEREKNNLKKAFMTFISSLVTNHQASLLITETNRSKFPEIIESILEYSNYLDDPRVARTAVITISNLVMSFGKNGKINDEEDKMGISMPIVDGLDQYLMTQSVRLSFELPFKNVQFNVNDVLFRQVAQEIAGLLKTCHQIKGDEFLNYLSEYLTNMGLSQQLMNDFGSHLVKSESRDFKKYFIDFIINIKN